MVNDEEWSHAPDWKKFTPNKILKKKCDCPDFVEKRCVGCAFSGTRFYWCRNCGEIYEVKSDPLGRILNVNSGI